jgi:hypothetical protein
MLSKAKAHKRRSTDDGGAIDADVEGVDESS